MDSETVLFLAAPFYSLRKWASKKLHMKTTFFMAESNTRQETVLVWTAWQTAVILDVQDAKEPPRVTQTSDLGKER